jgi:hypothetical protein
VNENEKYSRILELSSVGKKTAGTYPTFKDFKGALDTDRVFGDYEKRVIIISSDNRHVEYLFVREKDDKV